MIGPAELEDILLDLQAAALEEGTIPQPDVFHPSFAVLTHGSRAEITDAGKLGPILKTADKRES